MRKNHNRAKKVLVAINTRTESHTHKGVVFLMGREVPVDEQMARELKEIGIFEIRPGLGKDV